MCCATKSICCNWRACGAANCCQLTQRCKTEIRNRLSFRLPFIFSRLLEYLLHCIRSFVEMSNLKENCNLQRWLAVVARWRMGAEQGFSCKEHFWFTFSLKISVRNSSLFATYFFVDWLKIVYSCSLEHLAALAKIRNLHLLPDFASAAVGCILTMCFIPTATTRKLTATQIQRGTQWEGEESEREREAEIFKLQDKWKFISLAQTICLSCVFSL